MGHCICYREAGCIYLQCYKVCHHATQKWSCACHLSSSGVDPKFTKTYLATLWSRLPYCFLWHSKKRFPLKSTISNILLLSAEICFSNKRTAAKENSFLLKVKNKKMLLVGKHNSKWKVSKHFVLIFKYSFNKY